MKFLLDMPISARTTVWLRGQGHDAIHASDIELAKAPDIDILNRALQEGRILLTMDLDFPALLAHNFAREPGVIVIRMESPQPPLIHARLQILLQIHTEALLSSSIVIIEDTRIRLRRLPIR